MAAPSFLSTRGKVVASFAAAGVAVAAALLLVFDGFERPVDLTSLSALRVTESGEVTQDGVVVSRLDPDGVIRIPLINPSTSSYFELLDFSVEFSDPARVAVKPRLISIQGADASQYSWVGDSALAVFAGPYSPESHTVLELDADAGYFSPPIGWYARSFLHRISWQEGAAIGGMIFFAALVQMIRATRRPKWGNAQQLNIPPVGLTPIQLAVLHHSTIRPIDFVAFLCELAVGGYVQIIERSTGTLFLRTAKREGLASHEAGLLAILFPEEARPSYLHDVIASLNRDLFSAAASQLYVDIYDTFNARRFFTENPRIAHIRFKTAAILTQTAGTAFILVAALGLMATYPAILPIGIGVFAAGLLMYARARDVLPFSDDASAYVSECAAFVAYLSDGHPIGHEGSQGELFYRYLPYALAAEVEVEWLARFSNVPWYVPTWYTNDTEDIADPELFLGRVEAVAADLSQVMVSVKDPNAD